MSPVYWDSLLLKCLQGELSEWLEFLAINGIMINFQHVPLMCNKLLEFCHSYKKKSEVFLEVVQELCVGRAGHRLLIIKPTPTSGFAVTKLPLQLESSSSRIIQNHLLRKAPSGRNFKEGNWEFQGKTNWEFRGKPFQKFPIVTFGINILSEKIKICLYIPKV